MHGNHAAAAQTFSSTADGAVIDELFEALARGDITTARDCCASDVVIWHSHDCRPMTLQDVERGWEEFIANFPERAFTDVRRRATADGFVQQHLLVVRTRSGTRLAWPACVVVGVRDGQISRLDEYLDRSGHYTVRDDSELRTPGL
jgi:ketosteroid isomerase-like protein